MALSDALLAKLNAQITNEFYASQVYLAMACQFADLGLRSMSTYFRKQTEEERSHALKFLDYIGEVGGKVALAAIAQPPGQYPTVLAAIEAAVAHEKKVTQQIYELVALAEQENDYATRGFLAWFVSEQVEEVATMTNLAQVARMAGDNLLLLDTYVARLAAETAAADADEA